MLTLLFTVALLNQTCLFWQSPPPGLASGRSAMAVKASVFLAGVLVAGVGLYLTRNAYRRSTVGASGEGP